MSIKQNDYDSREADYILREAISNLKGKIDFLYFGGLDDLEDNESLHFFEKLRKTTDELYDLLNSNIIEKANKISELNRIIQLDLDLANRIQENILPTDAEVSKIKGIECCTKFIPMTSVGGDIYDITEIKPGLVRILLADATGHGVQAGLVTMLIKSEYNMIKNFTKSPSASLEFLNTEFVKNYINLTVFFTAIVIDIDITNKKIAYSSAGHPAQYHVDKNSNITLMEHSGKMIGLDKNLSFTQNEIIINSKDKIFLFSDGICEQFNNNNQMFGEERIKNIIKNNNDKPVCYIIDKIFDDLKSFQGNEENNDDFTIIGIDIE